MTCLKHASRILLMLYDGAVRDGKKVAMSFLCRVCFDPFKHPAYVEPTFG